MLLMVLGVTPACANNLIKLLFYNKYLLNKDLFILGGERGIRTLDTGLPRMLP